MRISNLPIEDSPYLLDKHGPIFILGCPRSGTTFLSSCVGSIPGTREFVGVLAPPRLMHLISNSENMVYKMHLLKCVKDIFWQSYWRDIYFKHNNLTRLLKRQITFKEFLAKPSLDNNLFCYKEPFLCFAAKEFSLAFPNSKFIHIIRDGRDNADSMERKYPHALSDEVLNSIELTENKNSEIGEYVSIDGFNYPFWVKIEERNAFKEASRYGRYLLMWKEMVNRGKELRNLGNERYYEIKYEDFVKEPIRYGHEIRSFIGADDSPFFRQKLKKAFSSSINISSQNQSSDKLKEADMLANGLLKELNYI